jgi:hypothetical protein
LLSSHLIACGKWWIAFLLLTYSTVPIISSPNGPKYPFTALKSESVVRSVGVVKAVPVVNPNLDNKSGVSGCNLLIFQLTKVVLNQQNDLKMQISSEKSCSQVINMEKVGRRSPLKVISVLRDKLGRNKQDHIHRYLYVVGGQLPYILNSQNSVSVMRVLFHAVNSNVRAFSIDKLALHYFPLSAVNVNLNNDGHQHENAKSVYGKELDALRQIREENTKEKQSGEQYNSCDKNPPKPSLRAAAIPLIGLMGIAVGLVIFWHEYCGPVGSVI